LNIIFEEIKQRNTKVKKKKKKNTKIKKKKKSNVLLLLQIMAMGSEDGTLHRHFRCLQLEIINALGKQGFHSSINMYLSTV